jgi:hypothetical protein
MKAYLSTVFALATAACSSDSHSNKNDGVAGVCEDVKAKVVECKLNVDTSGPCNANVDEVTVCSAKCAVKASCNEINGPPTGNAYYQCLAVCSGGSGDDFICADGTSFLAKAGVCDGVAQCPDGSDEASCPP